MHTTELYEVDGVKYLLLGGGGAEQDPILPGRTSIKVPANYPPDLYWKGQPPKEEYNYLLVDVEPGQKTKFTLNRFRPWAAEPFENVELFGRATCSEVAGRRLEREDSRSVIRRQPPCGARGTDRSGIAQLLLPAAAQAPADPLASWNDGPAKQAIVDFVRATTDRASPNFVPPEERIATFDQDGTLWVEHPMYSRWSTAWSACRRWWRRSRS